MLTVKADSADNAWLEIMFRHVPTFSRQESRVGPTREVIGASIQFPADTGILRNNARGMSMSYAVGELIWYMSGSDGPGIITKYAPKYLRFMEENNGDPYAHGAYGKRLFDYDQLNKAVELLQKDPDSRRCVLSFYSAEYDLGGNFRDIPCTLTMQLLVRNSELHAIVNMRSNDLWLGFPYDVFSFTGLQRLIADQLGLYVGSYIHNVGSLHVYESDLAKIGKAEISPLVHETFASDAEMFDINGLCLHMTEVEHKIRNGIDFDPFEYIRKDSFAGLMVETLLTKWKGKP